MAVRTGHRIASPPWRQAIPSFTWQPIKSWDRDITVDHMLHSYTPRNNQTSGNVELNLLFVTEMGGEVFKLKSEKLFNVYSKPWSWSYSSWSNGRPTYSTAELEARVLLLC